MGLFRSEPQPQEEVVSIEQLPAYVEVDPDHVNSGDHPIFDETCEIAPTPEPYNGPPIWK